MSNSTENIVILPLGLKSGLPPSQPGEIGEDRRFLILMRGKWRWKPTTEMMRQGFKFLTFGTELTQADLIRVAALNRQWDALRLENKNGVDYGFPPGTVGDGYHRALALRAKERQAKGKPPLTSEQESADHWRRSWRWLHNTVGNHDPKRVSPETLLTIYSNALNRVSLNESFMLLKTWRALWKKMAAMGYCDATKDPSKAISNTEPDPRQAFWLNEEIIVLVDIAWREGFKGLAAAIAVGWDTSMSPVDVRKLTLGKMDNDEFGPYFTVGRAKTGRAAAGTITEWSIKIFNDYLEWLREEGIELQRKTPIFRMRGSLKVPPPKNPHKKYATDCVLKALANGPRSRAEIVRAVTTEMPGIRLQVIDQAIYSLKKPPYEKILQGDNSGDYLLNPNPPLPKESKGSRWQPKPYTQNQLGRDFRKVRGIAFGKTETRTFADMRRSGLMEADAGGATAEVMSNKAANTMDANKRLKKTYNPVNLPSVRSADAHRLVGREKLKKLNGKKLAKPD